MKNKKSVILLSGRPRIGKTAVIKKAIILLSSKAKGFYCQEVRTNQKREGFEIITTRGEREYLALRTPKVRFSEEAAFRDFKVNLKAINSVAVPSLLEAMHENKIIIIDEIGPMEISSKPFRDIILRILDNTNSIALGTIAQIPNSFLDTVKLHPRVLLINVTVNNRDNLPCELYFSIMKLYGES